MRLIILILFFPIAQMFAQEERKILNLFFKSNSSEVSKKYEDQLLNLLKTSNTGELFIEKIIGYCDQNGSTESNKTLASKRILTVENIIVSEGFEVLEKIAAGETYPKNAINPNEYAYWRRVEIHYLIAAPISVIEEEIPSIPNQFATINIDSVENKSIEPIVLNIHFMPGQDVLIDNSQQEIENLYQFLRGNENVFAFIRGHVCCADDYPLSSARAYVIYSELVKRGIAPSRLKFQGFSNTLPAVSPEIIEEHRIKNRRVDVVFSIID